MSKLSDFITDQFWRILFGQKKGITGHRKGNTGALSWEIGYGRLDIIGNGEMPDYSPSMSNDIIFSNAPWYKYLQRYSLSLIHSGVTSIGSGAFAGWKDLVFAGIPNSVTRIGSNAFSGCCNLTSIIQIPDFTYTPPIQIPNSVMILIDYAWATVLGIKKQIPNSIQNCIQIPNTVTTIDDYAFAYCSGLTSVIIPESVTSIKQGTFYRCYALKSVTIPNSIKSIGVGAFYQCENLASVFIPDSVTQIEEGAFYKCERLTTVVIPNSVISIGKRAFYGNNSLASVTIPDSVTSIGELAFGVSLDFIVNSPKDIPAPILGDVNGHGSLIEIINNAMTPQKIESTVFMGVNRSKCILRVPAEAKDAYRTAEGWKDFVNIE